jgi:hypothetical protein
VTSGFYVLVMEPTLPLALGHRLDPARAALLSAAAANLQLIPRMAVGAGAPGMDHLVVVHGEPLSGLKFIAFGFTPPPASEFLIPTAPLVSIAMALATMPRGEADSAALAAADLLHTITLDAVKRILGV